MKISKEEVKALKYLANQRVHRIIEALGIQCTERYKYIFAPCPIHKGDRSDGWSFHLDLGVWQCFSRGCHDKFGKDIFGLVRGIMDLTFSGAIAWVKSVLERDGKISLDEVSQQQNNKAFISRAKQKEVVVYPEEILTRLKYHTYLESRGYPRKLVEAYQIGISDAKHKRMSNRIIIPVRDIDGRLVGFTGRTLYDDWKQRKIGKWEHNRGFQKDRNLFNIHSAAKYIAESGEAIICEGPLDVLRLEQAGIHNGVAIFGRKLHNGQIGLLMRAGATRLVIALDDDHAGITGMEKSKKLAEAFFDVRTVNVGGGRDIGDLSVEEIREIFGAEKETLWC